MEDHWQKSTTKLHLTNSVKLNQLNQSLFFLNAEYLSYFKVIVHESNTNGSL